MNAGQFLQKSNDLSLVYYYPIIKKTLDLLVALSVLIFFLPLLVFITLALAIVNKGKPLFVQERVGKNEKVFRLFKFRTMTDERDEFGKFLPDAHRLTSIGTFLRKTSLDELPQLVNVIKGDMSLVGPRPLLPKYLPRYSRRQAMRHRVRPGITGWAQINGRNSVPWEERFELDVYYVGNQSFTLDLHILLATIKRVLVREGISSSTSATMEEFLG